MRILGKIIFKAIEKPADNALKNHHDSVNRQLGYDQVAENINRRMMQAKLLATHFVIYVIVMILLRSVIPADIPFFWFVFLICPHGIFVVYYFMRWKPEILDTMDSPDNDEKPKHKPKSGDR